MESLPSEVHANAGRALLSDRYDHAEIFLKYGQVGCFVLVNWITPIKIRNITVTGNLGYAELNYITQRLEIYESKFERDFDGFGDVIQFGTSNAITVPIQVQEPLRVELEAFAESVRENRPFAVGGNDGVKAMRVVQSILEDLSEHDSKPK